jgi:phage terminase large subunit-like protein
MRGGTFQQAFCVKNLNMWVDAPDVWIPDEDVAANNAPYDESQLALLPCYVGIDFARKTDIVAVAFWFPDVKVVKYLFVVPSAKVKESTDRVDYRLWVQQGWLVTCPGSVIDEDWFMGTLLGWLKRYPVKQIAYDPWGMWNMLQKFGPWQDVLVPYRQDIRYMSVPTKELEAMVRRRELNFLGNPIIRWMFGNVVVYVDPNANIKLDKGKSREKIDGVVALVDAVGAWLNEQAKSETKQLYTDHSLRVLSGI